MTAPADREAAEGCARPGCPQPLVRKARGRPPIYCSAACRHLAARKGPPPRLTVEVDHQSDDGAGRPTGQVWIVRLRRGERVVEVATGLGRPSAEYLARQLREVLEPQRPAGGDAMR